MAHLAKLITPMIAICCVAATSTASFAQDGGRKLTATLTGAAEAPNPGDPDGTGVAALRVNPGRKQICYTLTVSNIDPATAAHIHEAPVGKAGPVVVGLKAPQTGSSEDCVSVTRELALEILKRPSDYYVNVHNRAFPSGAVRGQLGK